MSRVRILFFAVTIALLAASHRADATPPTYENIAYAAHWRQRMDLYIPQDRPGPFPVVAYFHGGGWLAGDKSAAADYVDDLLDRGFAIAAINYRFSYHATFPAQLYDCKGAIRWLRAHADDYGLDPTRFAAFGESAGGHLASLVGTTFDDPSLEGNVGGNGEFSSSVQAVIHGYGPTNLFELALFSAQRGSEITALIGHDIYDIIAHQNEPGYASLVALVNSANPATHAARTDPPAYIVHGDSDTVVPATQSELLADALDAAGAPETFRIMPGVGHEIPAGERPAIFEFLVANLAPLPTVMSFAGLDADEAFGTSIVAVGDLDGDGLDELAVGAPLNDDKGVDAGRVTIHRGSDGVILRTLRGRAAGERFGFSLAACGDIDGDGAPELAVGAPFARIGGLRCGRVDIFAASTGTRLRSVNGARADDRFGHAVAAADVDGDGIRELVVGIPYSDTPAISAGSVEVYSCTTGSLLRRFKGAAKNDRFGSAVAAAGDVDGDGRSDIIIGAPLADVAGTNGGSMFVYGYNGAQWIRRLTQHGSSGEQLGSAVTGLGDVDGDGLSDVAAGAPKADSGGVAAGVVRIYAPVSGLLLTTIEPVGPQAGEDFGQAIANVGDLDGDDRVDIAIGSPRRDLAGVDTGRVTWFTGVGSLLRICDGPMAGAKFGSTLAGRFEATGHSPRDIAVGATEMNWSGIRRGAVYILNAGTTP